MKRSGVSMIVPIEHRLYFSYMPPEVELQLTESVPTSMDVEGTAVDPNEPETKRQKTEGMVE